MERGTNIGNEFIKIVKQDKNIPANMVVRMLNKIIYSGQATLNKFILTNFPQQIDQVKEFEAGCSKIAAIIYPTTNSATVDIPQKELSLFNIESLFQKEFRLKTMSEWSFQLFNEKLGNKVEFGVLVGKSLSGKSEAAKCLATNQGYKIIDMNAVSAACKAKMGTEEEPFEGEVPIAQVEKQICANIEAARASGDRCKFVFDSYTHSNEEQFINFVDQFGCPEFILCMTASEKTIKERWCKKNEAEEVGEEAIEGIKADSATNIARIDHLSQHYEQFGDRCNIINLNTSTVASIESLNKDLNNKFSPKVILVNHEKKLGVDNTCSNLAIKYNMIYISAYQVIKQHITSKTAWGVKLLANQRPRGIVSSVHVKDDFQEADFSPVHFDLTTVMQLLKETVSSKKTNQKYVLLEGLCNSLKLSEVDDQLELRFMDEFFGIEGIIGEVKAIIGLQFQEEPEYIRDDQIEWEKFAPVEKVVEKAKPAEGEEEEAEAPVEEEGEKKGPVFKKEDF